MISLLKTRPLGSFERPGTVPLPSSKKGYIQLHPRFLFREFFKYSLVDQLPRASRRKLEGSRFFQWFLRLSERNYDEAEKKTSSFFSTEPCCWPKRELSPSVVGNLEEDVAGDSAESSSLSREPSWPSREVEIELLSAEEDQVNLDSSPDY